MKKFILNFLRSGRFFAIQNRPILRAGVGIAATVATFGVTFEPRLTSEVFRSMVLDGNFLQGLARTSWYLRRGWPGINLSRDPTSNFSKNLELPDLQAQMRFLKKRQARLESGLFEAEQTYIAAAIATETFGTAAYDAALLEFVSSANQKLTLALTSDLPATLQHSAEVVHTDFSVADAHRAFQDLAALLDGLGSPWFILSGTLLGAVREGDFLPHDHDIDVGVFDGEADLDAILKAVKDSPLFFANLWQTQQHFSRGKSGALELTSVPVLLKVSHVSGVQIDIFLHYREGETNWHGSSLQRWDNTDFSLSDYELAGVRVSGPSNADLYLTENYGTWRIPKVAFNTSVDTTNQSIVISHISLAIFLRRIWILRSRSAEEADAQLAQLEAAGLIVASSNRQGGWAVSPDAFAPRIEIQSC